MNQLRDYIGRPGLSPLALVAQLLIVALLAGCNGSSSSSSSASSTTTVHATAPGCGTYCAVAGVGQADVPPGYPCQSGRCMSCPPGSCMTLLSTSATDSHAQFAVKLTCNLSTPCVGAFLLCVPRDLCGANPHLPPVYGGRLAGSDFRIPPRQTAAVEVALTPPGQQLVVKQGGYRGDVLVDLLNYGDIKLPVPPAAPPPDQTYYSASVRLTP